MMSLWEIMDILYKRGELEAYQSLKQYINNMPVSALIAYVESNKEVAKHE